MDELNIEVTKETEKLLEELYGPMPEEVVNETSGENL